jgi:hypothetical protein
VIDVNDHRGRTPASAIEVQRLAAAKNSGAFGECIVEVSIDDIGLTSKDQWTELPNRDVRMIDASCTTKSSKIRRST